MTLAPHVCELENQILGDFTLYRQVILFGVLRTHVRCCLAVKKNWHEQRLIHRLISRGAQYAVKRIGCGTSVLILERQIEHRIVNAGASTERRLGAKLFHYQLFDRVVENSKASAN